MGSQSKLLSCALLAWALAAGSCTPGKSGTSGDDVDGGTGTGPEQRPSSVEVLRDVQYAEQARLPEQEDGHLIAVEVYPDRLVFIYSAPPQVPLEAGQVVAGAEGGGYLRRLLEVRELSPTRIEATTAQAELTDLITDAHIVVRASTRPDGGTMADGDIGGRSEALNGMGKIELVPRDSDICRVSTGTSDGVQGRPYLAIDGDVEFELDISWSELRTFRFVFDGYVEAGVDVEAQTMSTITCAIGSDDLAPEGGRNPLATEFVGFIGWIPYTITLTPQGEVKLQGQSDGTFRANADGRIGIRAGYVYTQEGGSQPIWEPSREGMAALEADSRLSVTGELSAGFDVEVKLLDLVGPAISPSAVYAAEWGVDSCDLCTWTTKDEAGVEVEIQGRLDVPVIDYALAEVTYTLELARATLSSSSGQFPGCEPATCDTCNAAEGCGFCESTGQCMGDSRAADCEGGAWRDSPQECMDCSAQGSTCDACLMNAFCGWCGSSGQCMAAPPGGGSPGDCGGGWAYTACVAPPTGG